MSDQPGTNPLDLDASGMDASGIDRSGMDAGQREMDQMLREYAGRWRAAQAAPPAAMTEMAAMSMNSLRPARIRRRRRWKTSLAVLSAAATVVLVTIGVALLRPHSPAPWPPVASGPVPWAELPATGTVIPTVTPTPTPDSSVASLPSCAADSLQVSVNGGVAAGTISIDLEITSSTPCRLTGFPEVTALDPTGTALDVPMERLGEAGPPVAVGPGTVATVSFRWGATWCAAEIDVARLRVELPEGGGEFTVVGFGPSRCYGTPGDGTKGPMWVQPFRPRDYREPEPSTVFGGVGLDVRLPASVPAGGTLAFEVTLTAPADRDVPLAPCPDYEVSLGERSWTYGLNCAAVPYRDAAGQPRLPAGVPITFEMSVPLPAQPVSGVKVAWRLQVVDVVARGSTIDVS